MNTDTNRDPEKIKESIQALNDYFLTKIQGVQKSKDDSNKEDQTKKLA